MTPKEQRLFRIAEALFDKHYAGVSPKPELSREEEGTIKAYLALAKLEVKQYEAKMDEDRDAAQEFETSQRRIVAEVGKPEAEYITTIGVALFSKFSKQFMHTEVTAEKMIFLYYAGVSAAEAIRMFETYAANLLDKVQSIHNKLTPRG